jgi:endonuclease III
LARTSSGPRTRAGSTPLADAIGVLARHYGATPSLAPGEPFELLLWEYVAYLTDDADRSAAFASLKKRVGTKPDEVAAASEALLESIARAGGAIAFRLRAQRMKDVAVRVRDRFQGSLASVLKLPYLEARRVLKTFPAIGPPGADKILLLTGAQPVLALDSNALRVLLRLGFGEEQKSYSASYTSAQKAATAQLPSSIPNLQKDSLLLRRHGQDLCKRIDPRCPVCPLRDVCKFANVK